MSNPAIDSVRARAFRIPTPEPEADATLEWDATTMVVVHVTAGGVTGLGWTYADAACVPLINGKLADVVTGRPLLDVPARWAEMQRAIRNLGRPGLVSCSMSAVDTALWDAAARFAGLPLARLLGAVHDEVALYGSGGFTTQSGDELRAWLDECVHKRHLAKVKIKIGPGADLARIAIAREVIGTDTTLFVDANGGYTVGQARRMAHRLAEFDVRWFEEPVSSDDLAGLAVVRAMSTVDIAAGEYGYDLAYFARMVAAGAVDCLQVDVTRCGGYTEWRRAAAVAAAAGLDVSAHCAPNLAAHAGVATQNFRHLEWFADHDRIESALLDGALDPTGGRVRPDLDLPGHGFTFKLADAERYAV